MATKWDREYIEMGFCTKCGAKIDVNSQFCVKCGTQISVVGSDGAKNQISEFRKGWKKQYLIKTKGTVVVERERVYSIAARDFEEAQIKAKSIYGSEFKPVDIICVDAEDRLGRSMAAMFFMMIAIVIAFINDDLRPNFTTCIYAIVIELSVIIRAKGIKNTVNSWIDIVFMVLIVLLISSILRPLASSYQPGWMRKIEKTVREIYEFFKKDGDDFTFAIPTHFFLIASILFVSPASIVHFN